MALTVEDGTGLANAESYASVSDADTYWLNRPVSALAAPWAAATTGNKEASLRTATAYLDASYAFKGTIATDEQALQWPRVEVYNSRATELTDVVPTKVIQATIELAARALSGDLLPDTTRGGQVKCERVDKIEVEYMDGAPAGTQYPFISGLLTGLTTGGNGVVSLGRA